MKLLRLPGRKLCEYVLRRGRVWKGRHMTVRWLPGAPKHPLIAPHHTGIYVGLVASTRLDASAVKRNRMRRRCREALRTQLQKEELSVCVQLLILPRSSSLVCAFPELENDVRAFLSILPVWRKNDLPGNS